MTEAEDNRDTPRDEAGITFGLGIDIEAFHEAFMLYAACGGQEEDTGEELPFPLG